MKSRVYLSAALFSIFWLFLVIFPALSQGAPPGMIGYGQGDYLDASKQTWKEYPTPIKDPLGHPTRPWQPNGEYPWKQPYSAAMLMYFNEDHELFGSKYQNGSLMSLRLNRRGLLTQRRGYVAMETLYDNYLRVNQSLPTVPVHRPCMLSHDKPRRAAPQNISHLAPWPLPGLCRTVYPSVEFLGQTVYRSTIAAASSSAPPSFLATGKIIRYNPLYEEPNYIT